MNRGVLPRLDHPGQVVQRGVDVRAAHRLDERAGHVVVLVAVAVVAHRGPVDRGLQGGQRRSGPRPWPGPRRRRPPARSAPAGRRRRRSAAGARRRPRRGAAAPPRPRSSASARRTRVAMSSSVSGSRVSSSERDSSGLTTEKNGFSVVAATSVTDPVLDRAEQRVLLGLGEAVHLVDEQHGLPAGHAEVALGLLDDRADLLDAGVERGQRDEAALGGAGDDVRDRGLAGAGRAPQDQRHRRVALDQPAQRRARAEQVPLADDLVQACAGASGPPAGRSRPPPARPRRRTASRPDGTRRPTAAVADARAPARLGGTVRPGRGCRARPGDARGVFAAIGRFCARRRWPVLAAWLLLVAAGAVASGPVFARLGRQPGQRPVGVGPGLRRARRRRRRTGPGSSAWSTTSPVADPAVRALDPGGRGRGRPGPARRPGRRPVRRGARRPGRHRRPRRLVVVDLDRTISGAERDEAIDAAAARLRQLERRDPRRDRD